MPVESRRRPRVLVIDDDPSIRDYLETLATRQGYEVHAVAAGKAVDIAGLGRLELGPAGGEEGRGDPVGRQAHTA